jgi:hypothetical protein
LNGARIKKTKTVVGLVVMLEVVGSWRDEYVALAQERGCNGVQWYMNKDSGSNCDPLAALADSLTFVRVRSARPIDDGALASMSGLRFIDATTRAKNRLDLSGAVRLSTLMIDDRKGLEFARGDALRTVELYYNTRHISFFEGADHLESLQLESRLATVVNCTGDMSGLKRLRLIKGVVSSLAGLRAPNLQFLSLDRVGGAELDLADLAECPSLRQVSITPRETVVLRNVESFTGDLMMNDHVKQV